VLSVRRAIDPLTGGGAARAGRLPADVPALLQRGGDCIRIAGELQQPPCTCGDDAAASAAIGRPMVRISTMKQMAAILLRAAAEAMAMSID